MDSTLILRNVYQQRNFVAMTHNAVRKVLDMKLSRRIDKDSRIRRLRPIYPKTNDVTTEIQQKCSSSF
uniref:Transposase n=1 Tax=Ascaris lumbricoides TaxID=6252 RepID=A0A0M3I8R9_ASCLU